MAEVCVETVDPVRGSDFDTSGAWEAGEPVAQEGENNPCGSEDGEPPERQGANVSVHKVRKWAISATVCGGELPSVMSESSHATPSSVHDQLRVYVRQAAETARMMGVDFLPVYANGSTGITIEVEDQLIEAVVPGGAAPATLPSAFQERPVAAPDVPARPSFAETMAKSINKPVVAVKPPAVAAKGAGRVEVPEPLIALPSRGPEPKVSGAVAAARSIPEKEAAMAELRSRYEAAAPHKRFETPHTTIVWGEGDLNAHVMFIGEAPGDEEDKSGRPFVGRAGKLLTDMVGAMGLSREQIYIANIVKVRPPNNATPSPEQCAASEPYLIEQMAIVGPKVIVSLGLPATRTLLKKDATMGAFRGTWATLNLPDGRLIEVMPTYHPSYVLRSYTDEVRGKVWSDLQQVMKRLGLKGVAAKK
jgi:uracil-DNA glycosylase family 4